ncbi:uncharacterized protein LOC106152410 [Lingula anatina]|uniref:Uncharacterized protein LOC106152410 n=1 Tax=Lingula anatina TaxID=7574 RepID=A0A1S3H5K5_LINAN|nr:uncharacterized protein LOC106152410 [Lingula anatina]|eukprot:XP_013381420.1 uncharacterized protein LOC106152410 [Lingula anatina]
MFLGQYFPPLALVVCLFGRCTEGAERRLMETCDPQQDICIAKYSSCEACVGNVNGVPFGMIEKKGGVLETLPGTRVCSCLPGYSAVSMASSTALLARRRFECVPVEGSTCFTDGDCNIRNLDCFPLLSVMNTLFQGIVQSSDSIFPPPGVTGATLTIIQFVANFLQLMTQFLCGFNRMNTIDYKCIYQAPAKTHNSYSMASHYGFGFTKGTQQGYAGICKRVERNAGYPAPKDVGKGAFQSHAPIEPSYHGDPYGTPSYGSFKAPTYSSFKAPTYGSFKAPSYASFKAPSYGSFNAPSYGSFKAPSYGLKAPNHYYGHSTYY